MSAKLTIRIASVQAFAVIALCLSPMSYVLAQKFPERAIDLVVPFPPGGITDVSARLAAGYLARKWGQPVNVRNIPGEGGATGTMFVLRSARDGYTMLMSATGQATQNPALISDLPYRWDEPTLVARVNVSPIVFVVGGDSRWDSLRELMDAIRANPGKFKYGTSGAGGVGSIAIAQLLASSGIDGNSVGRVEFQGGGPILQAVADGRTDFGAQYLGEMRSLLEKTRLRALAVSTPRRVTQLPDVPTGVEAGYDAFTLIGWNGIAGPAGLTDTVIRDWDIAIRQLTVDPAFVADMRSLGAEASYLGPKEFRQVLELEYLAARKLVEKLGLRK